MREILSDIIQRDISRATKHDESGGARSLIRFSKEGRRAISIGSWTRLIIFLDSGAFSAPPTAISFYATPRPFPWGKGDAGIASASIRASFRYSCGQNEGTNIYIHIHIYIKRGDPFARVGRIRSRVLFPCSMPVEELLVPIDRLETIPGHYGGVAIGGRRTTSGREWLGRRRTKKQGGENAERAATILSLSLSSPPSFSSCHSSMHRDSLCTRRTRSVRVRRRKVCARVTERQFVIMMAQ